TANGRSRPQARAREVSPARRRRPDRHRRRGRVAARCPGAYGRRPGRRAGGSLTTTGQKMPPRRKLAINRLKERKPLGPVIVDRFLARHEVPIIEGNLCTFLFRGDADEVHLGHQIFGLPGHIPLRRVADTDLWYLVLELPDRSRVEYQL